MWPVALWRGTVFATIMDADGGDPPAVSHRPGPGLCRVAARGLGVDDLGMALRLGLLMAAPPRAREGDVAP